MSQPMIKVFAVFGLLLYGLFALLSVFVVWGVVYALTLQWSSYTLVILGAAAFYLVLFVALFRRADRIRSLLRILRGEQQG